MTYSCTTTNGAGLTASASVSVKRDATNPLIGYTGNAGSYTVDQTVAITCSASDALSGIATNSCANVNGAAYTFAVGANPFSASATDRAGNSAGATTSFTVAVTSGSLCELTKRFVSQNGIANSLCVKLTNSQRDADRGNTNAAKNVLDAYINELEAQSGKALTSGNATILINLARVLQASLNSYRVGREFTAHAGVWQVKTTRGRAVGAPSLRSRAGWGARGETAAAYGGSDNDGGADEHDVLDDVLAFERLRKWNAGEEFAGKSTSGVSVPTICSHSKASVVRSRNRRSGRARSGIPTSRGHAPTPGPTGAERL